MQLSTSVSLRSRKQLRTHVKNKYVQESPSQNLDVMVHGPIMAMAMVVVIVVVVIVVDRNAGAG